MQAHVFAAGGQPTDLKVLGIMFVCEVLCQAVSTVNSSFKYVSHGTGSGEYEPFLCYIFEVRVSGWLAKLSTNAGNKR